MSKPRTKFEPEVLKALSELDHPEAIQASPWFHSRTMTRIHALGESPASASIWSWMRRWLRPALVTAIIVLNIAVTAQVWITATSQSSQSKSTEDPISVLAVEYGYQSSGVLWDWSGE